MPELNYLIQECLLLHSADPFLMYKSLTLTQILFGIIIIEISETLQPLALFPVEPFGLKSCHYPVIIDTL